MTANTESWMQKPLSRSYIEPHEREEARLLVQSSLACETLPDLRPDYILVKVFAREEEIVTLIDHQGREVMLIVPESMRCHDGEYTHTALVIERGWACPEEGVQVGDFVLIPRHEGTEFLWQNIVMRLLPAASIYGVVQSPRKLHREERID